MLGESFEGRTIELLKIGDGPQAGAAMVADARR